VSRQAEHNRKKREETAEIGPLPEVVSPDRKAACRFNLLLFLQAYFPHSTGSGVFSAAHVEFIDDLENALLHGGRVARAVFRGFAKTTIGENASLWALLYGHKRFLPLVGADKNAASLNLSSIKTELMTNDRLLEDFPEVCWPVQALENKPQRCASQTLGGQLTRMQWTADRLVFADVTGSAASGSCLMTTGFECFNRGLKHKLPTGEVVRPDFVFIDDPQTDASASTDHMVRKRERKLAQTILKSAGHKSPMSVFVAGTKIRKGCLMDRLTDPELYPSFRARTHKMVNRWSDTHETLWLDRYAAIRRDFDRAIPGSQQEAADRATEFYEANRVAMDAGADVTWHACFMADHGEVSALQHAYNVLIDDGPEAFAAECQNEPLEERGDLCLVEGHQLERKCGAEPRGVLPASTEWLVASIDVQGSVLYWFVWAFDQRFGGQLVDYGVWPEQPRRELSLRGMRRTMADQYGGSDADAQVRAALDDLFRVRIAREWERIDGAKMRPTIAGVDANYQASGKGVRAFCAQSQVGFPVVPTIGRSIKATNAPMAEWPQQEGRRVGDGWVLTKPSGRTIRTLLVDTNLWKTRAARQLATPLAGEGCLSLYRPPQGEERTHHRQVCEQLTVEAAKKVESGGRTVFEWTAPPGADNHATDGLVIGMACASLAGLVRGGPAPNLVKRKRRSVRYA
jgi:hypothetical protein